MFLAVREGEGLGKVSDAVLAVNSCWGTDVHSIAAYPSAARKGVEKSAIRPVHISIGLDGLAAPHSHTNNGQRLTLKLALSSDTHPADLYPCFLPFTPFPPLSLPLALTLARPKRYVMANSSPYP